MAEIKFTSKEHENFYKEMLQKSGNSDSYHRAFFTVSVFLIRPEEMQGGYLILNGTGLSRTDCTKDGRQGERCALQGLLSTSGMDMWNRGRKVCQRLMKCLTVAMPPISMKPYAYAIRNIAGIYRKTVKRAAGRKDNAFGNFTGTGNKEVRQWGKRLRQGQFTGM